MGTFQRNYVYEGVTYVGLISRKRMRSSLRMTFFAEKREIHVSIAPYVGMEELDDFVTKHLPKLVKRVERKQGGKAEEGVFYILGEKRPLEAVDAKASLALHKKEAKALFLERLRHYESLMRIERPYALSVREVSSRFGSNSSKTHRIMLSLALYSFTLDVIDSVVVHELAHDTFRSHGKRFYAKVEKYCPNYWELRKRLIYNLYSPEMEIPKGRKEKKDVE